MHKHCTGIGRSITKTDRLIDRLIHRFINRSIARSLARSIGRPIVDRYVYMMYVFFFNVYIHTHVDI